MRAYISDGASVNTPAPSSYVAPSQNYFPRDNDFTDYAQRTLTGAGAKVYDTVVRLCDRATGLCRFDSLHIANVAGVGHSTARAQISLLVERGFLARIRNRVYRGVDAGGRECYRGGAVHYQVLGKEAWQIVPKPPRKPRGKPRPQQTEAAPAARSLAEIKQADAENKQRRAQNKQAKQDWSFKTPSQNNNTPRSRKVEAVPVPQPTAVVVSDVVTDLRRDGTQNTPECEPSQPNEKNPSGTFVSPLLAEVLAVGVKPASARQIVAQHPPSVIRLQLDCLPDREPRRAAAVLVKAIREDWEPPAKYLQRQEAARAQERAQEARQAQEARREREAVQRAQEAKQHDEEATRLEAQFEAMPEMKRQAVERELDKRFAMVAPFLRNSPPARAAMRRSIVREWDAST